MKIYIIERFRIIISNHPQTYHQNTMTYSQPINHNPPTNHQRCLWHNYPTMFQRYISCRLECNSNGLVYIAIGSHQDQVPGIEDKRRQQTPPWLVQLKCENPDMSILIVLMDPVFIRAGPLIDDGIYGGSWGQCVVVEGVGSKWVSEHGLELITTTLPASYEETLDHLNIASLLQSLAPCCTHSKLVVVADFTGRNLSIVQQLVNHNEMFMCIDPTHGLDPGCSPDFDVPGLSPVFVNDGHGLRFKTISDITGHERHKIMNSRSELLTTDERSFKKWIGNTCRCLRVVSCNELPIILRMLIQIIRVQSNERELYENISASITRCVALDIDLYTKDIIGHITYPEDVYTVMRYVLNCIAEIYAKNMNDFERSVNALIELLHSEQNEYELSRHINKFDSDHFSI